MNTERRKKIEDQILIFLRLWSDDGAPEFEGMWHGYAELFDNVRRHIAGEPLTMSELKSAMRRLRDLAMVRYATTMNVDYKPSGSGYFITVKGLEAYDELMRDAYEAQAQDAYAEQKAEAQSHIEAERQYLRDLFETEL